MQAGTKSIRKLKILCFHGYFNNVEVIEYQLKHFKALFGDYVQFDAINAPHECKEVFDFTIHKKFKDPFFSWYFFKDQTHECEGISESIKYVVDYINEHGPYDGVLGFSQGATIARIMLKLKEFKSKLPEITNGIPKFGMFFSGIFNEKAKYFQEYSKDSFKLMVPYKQPTLWVYGDRDPLIQKCKYAVVEEGDYTKIVHKHGHNIPKFIEEDLDT